MMFLAAVLFSAVQYGLLPSLFASILSTLSYNYFFLDPVHTFTVADPSNVIALFFFLMVAILTSNLTAKVRAIRGVNIKTARPLGTSRGMADGQWRSLARLQPPCFP